MGHVREPPSRNSSSELASVKHTFRSNVDRKAKWIWVGAGISAAACFALVTTLRPQMGDQGRLYLLSSIAQSLAATVALAATLPLAFAGLSRYVAGAARQWVGNCHFLAFIGMYILSALLALGGLCFSCMPGGMALVSLSLTAGCLVALPFYIRWIADRSDPGNYLDYLLVRADRIALKTPLVAENEVPPDTSKSLRQELSALSSVASTATADGVTLYMDGAQSNLLQFWMKYDFRRVGWVTRLCGDTWSSLALSHISDETFVARMVQIQNHLFLRECVARRLSLSEGIVQSLSGPLTLVVQRRGGTVLETSAELGLWMLASVAHHLGHSENGPRRTAHSLALARFGLSAQQFAEEVDGIILRVMTEAEHTVSRTDIEPDIRAFARLVLDEYAELRRGLGVPPSQIIPTPQIQCPFLPHSA